MRLLNFQKLELSNNRKGIVLGETEYSQANGNFIIGVLETGETFYFDAADSQQGIVNLSKEICIDKELESIVNAMSQKLLLGVYPVYVQSLIELENFEQRDLLGGSHETTTIYD